MSAYQHITIYERRLIAMLLSKGLRLGKVAVLLGRSRSTIQREVKRNGLLQANGKRTYEAEAAHLKSLRRKSGAGYGKGYRYCDLSKGTHLFTFRQLLPSNAQTVRRHTLRLRRKTIAERAYRSEDNRRYCPHRYYWLKISRRISPNRSRRQSQRSFSYLMKRKPSLKWRFSLNASHARLKRKRKSSLPIPFRRYSSLNIRNKKTYTYPKHNPIHISGLWLVFPKDLPAETKHILSSAPRHQLKKEKQKTYRKQESKILQGKTMSAAVLFTPDFKNWTPDLPGMVLPFRSSA